MRAAIKNRQSATLCDVACKGGKKEVLTVKESQMKMKRREGG